MNPKKALIFDDNKECRSLMKEIVAQFGYEAMTFSDPTVFLSKQAETCCQMDHEPCADLIVTDNRMPGMTGLEFLEMTKNNGCKLFNTKKAAVSGSWTNEELACAKKLACRVFDKPTQLKELEEWLTSLSN